MEQMVIFRDNQELQAGDLNNAQQWASDAIDHVVLDTIESGSAYAGFGVTKAQQTSVSVAAGRLYKNGAVYSQPNIQTLDFYNDLPIVTQRQYAVVLSGQSVDTDIQPRNFIIDADTGQSQPQSVAMETDRVCNVAYVRGVESADPQVPATDATVLVVAYVTCDTTGVINVTQVAANQVPNLGNVSDLVSSIETDITNINTSIQTIRTDLANLANQLLSYTPLSSFVALSTVVSNLVAKVNGLIINLLIDTDFFVDTSQSDTAANVDGAYNAYVHEGLRFPPSNASGTASLQLLNPSEPFAQVNGGFMIPVPSGSRIRMDCSFPSYDWIAERILQYTFWNFNCIPLAPSRWRHCCGPRYMPNSDAIVWGSIGVIDPTVHIFSFVGETWESVYWNDLATHSNEDDPDWPRPGKDRDKYFWRDWVDLPYWSRENLAPVSCSGQHIAQTFLNAQDGWLTSVTVYAMAAYWQPLTVMITGCDAQGNPDQANQLITKVAVDGPTLQQCSENIQFAGDIEVIERTSLLFGLINFTTVKEVPVYVYPVRIPIPPTFLKAGSQYAFHVFSTYDHSFAVCNSFDAFQIHQGEYYASQSSSGLSRWNSNVSPKSLRFQLHYATWARWATNPTVGGALTYDISLQPLQLAGGINNVEVLTKAIIPDACEVSYQVQIGGVWVPFDGGEDSPSFAGNPALIPFRVEMSGTTDLMPGISLTPSQVTLAGPSNASFHHISNPYTFTGTATKVEVTARLSGFVSAHHTVSASLHYGSTHNTSSTLVDTPMPDGTIDRVWTFTGLSLAGSGGFQVELDGTTDGAIDNFFISQSVRYAVA